MDVLETIFDHDLFPLVVLILVVTFIIIKYRKATYHNRVERKLPTSKIAAVTVGLVEVCGRLRSAQNCESPYFKNECIGYCYKIEKV